MPSCYANGRSIIHKGDGLVQTAVAPDVCKTPSPGGPIPVPYPNIAMDSDLDAAAESVLIEGNPTATKSSNLKVSTGDEAGSAGGGVISSKIKGKMTWTDASPDVKAEGDGVVRFLDPTMHNGNASNAPGVDKGGPTGPSPPAKICPPHSWIEITKDTRDERLAKLDGSKDAGAPYNACMARKKNGDPSRTFKCAVAGCSGYQEVDMVVDGAPCECKSADAGAKKRQTLNYIEISKQLFGGKGVTIFMETAANAAKEAPHVANWGATVEHDPC
jgi:Domain of unknown function (DUF4150)